MVYRTFQLQGRPTHNPNPYPYWSCTSPIAHVFRLLRDIYSIYIHTPCPIHVSNIVIRCVMQNSLFTSSNRISSDPRRTIWAHGGLPVTIFIDYIQLIKKLIGITIINNVRPKIEHNNVIAVIVILLLLPWFWPFKTIPGHCNMVIIMINQCDSRDRINVKINVWLIPCYMLNC
jgi:hypothetical protein